MPHLRLMVGSGSSLGKVQPGILDGPYTASLHPRGDFVTQLQTLAPKPRDLGGGFMVRRLLPSADRARRRPVRLLRPLRADRRRPRRASRRPAASAHRPGDADLPVRGRDHASRLDRRGAADRARRGQLDVGRTRHRPLRANAEGFARPVAPHPRPAALGRFARGARGLGAVVPASAGRREFRAFVSTARPCTSSSAAPSAQSSPVADLRRRRWRWCSTSTSPAARRSRCRRATRPSARSTPSTIRSRSTTLPTTS